jgi:hypothetical protein
MHADEVRTERIHWLRIARTEHVSGGIRSPSNWKNFRRPRLEIHRVAHELCARSIHLRASAGICGKMSSLAAGLCANGSLTCSRSLLLA